MIRGETVPEPVEAFGDALLGNPASGFAPVST
jgi:hypothetical protein